MGTAESGQRSGSLPQDKEFSRTDFDNFLKGYRSQCTERDFWLSDDMIEGEYARQCLSFMVQNKHEQHISTVILVLCTGEIPEELTGTLLRNGPGLFEVGGVGISQPLDGDGMVCYLPVARASAAFEQLNKDFRVVLDPVSFSETEPNSWHITGTDIS